MTASAWVTVLRIVFLGGFLLTLALLLHEDLSRKTVYLITLVLLFLSALSLLGNYGA